MDRMKYIHRVATLKVDAKKCTGCGICLEVCPHEVLAAGGKAVEIIDLDACMECGACSMNCPFQAISVNAGVGCAAAFILGSVGSNGESCCCPETSTSEPACCGGPGKCCE